MSPQFSPIMCSSAPFSHKLFCIREFYRSIWVVQMPRKIGMVEPAEHRCADIPKQATGMFLGRRKLSFFELPYLPDLSLFSSSYISGMHSGTWEELMLSSDSPCYPDCPPEGCF